MSSAYATRGFLLATKLLLASSVVVPASGEYRPRAAWMASGWGVTLSLGAHNRDGPNGATNRTIATVAEWNEVVNGFDVAGTVAQLVEVKASWVFLAVRRTNASMSFTTVSGA